MKRAWYLAANMCAVEPFSTAAIDQLNSVRFDNLKQDNYSGFYRKMVSCFCIWTSQGMDIFGTTIQYMRFEPKDDLAFEKYIEEHALQNQRCPNG